MDNSGQWCQFKSLCAVVVSSDQQLTFALPDLQSDFILQIPVKGVEAQKRIVNPDYSNIQITNPNEPIFLN
ncbi:hypothetical protein DP923_00870 [Pontibacter arcticus]|uniref:Uncharacterized protein n=1 Tax=Pontibacter arcticus TaxID=2080288 RepID=A0A364RH75_9BACT|nr:hypothetical protein DP923_00870 [Pontibacter arcticus]